MRISDWSSDVCSSDLESGTIFQSANFQVPAAGTGCLVVPDRPPCTMETPQIAGSYSREKQVSNTFETEVAWNTDNFDAVAKFGKTKATGGPSMRFGVAVKPRLTIHGQEQKGNFLNAVDLTGGNLNMEFSPEQKEHNKNRIDK